VAGRGVLLVTLAALAVALPGSAARQSTFTGVYTGYGFDACSAPSTASLQAWSASPYRALGIYIGGANRGCSQPNLNASWIVSATGLGWNLLPLYVGLQAPCVGQSGLQKFSANVTTAASQGRAAADDAAAQSAALALPSGSPVWFDLEGYTRSASCTAAVQSFVAAWTTQLKSYGYLAGVYGSAASTIRDVAAITTTRPDVVWIANWNGVESVFGDPYVSDALWPTHQRIHQYRGGHKETWGGVTINIDNNYVDSIAVTGTPPSPLPPPPPPPAVGQVNSGDGLAVVNWPSTAFSVPVVVTLTPTSQLPSTNGYAVQLAVSEQQTTAPVDGFGAPVTLHLLKPSAGLVPVFSTDGMSWKPLPRLTSAGLSNTVLSAYTILGDGTTEIQTLVPGFFGLLADLTPPTTPPAFGGRLVNGSLVLSWAASTDDAGVIAGYNVLLDGTAVAKVKPTSRRVTVRNFHGSRQTVYRLQAIDGAGNVSKPTAPVVVKPKPRPAGLPRAIPRWAFALYSWQHTHTGARPKAAPKKPPKWYWTWAGWRATPFRLR
jgi:hypothetical protein